jgi:hypothetical protein
LDYWGFFTSPSFAIVEQEISTQEQPSLSSQPSPGHHRHDRVVHRSCFLLAQAGQAHPNESSLLVTCLIQIRSPC